MHDLREVRARDIMQHDVVTLSPSASIESAIATFEDQHIGGAPVVDMSGTVLGMLSSSDIVKPDHVRAGRIDAGRGSYEMIDPDGAESELDDSEDQILSMDDFSPEGSRSGTVAEWMSRNVVSVGPEWTLPRICELLSREGIHRVPVIHERRLQGIVSSSDVVRCVARLAKTRAR